MWAPVFSLLCQKLDIDANAKGSDAIEAKYDDFIFMFGQSMSFAYASWVTDIGVHMMQQPVVNLSACCMCLYQGHYKIP
jgi:hypothetical protein